MFKKLFCAAMAIAATAVSGMAVSAADTYYEPYVLCYNSTHNGSHEGIHAGWSFDNRGGGLKTTISGNYNTFADISNIRASAMIRDINRTDEGFVVLETAFRITGGLNGFSLGFSDENMKDTYKLAIFDGGFVTLQPDGSYRKLCDVPSTYSTSFIRVRVKLDFENKTVLTVINDVAYGIDSLLSDNIMRFAYRTTPEDILTVILSGTTKITANYYLHEDFLFHSDVSRQIPYGWTSTSTTNAYISSAEGKASNGAALSKRISPAVGGKLAFEGFFNAAAGQSGSISMLSGNNTAFDISFNGTEFTALNEKVYPDIGTAYLSNFWYRFRIEADLDKHTAIVKINGRKVGEVQIPQNIKSVDSIKISATGEGVKFDEIKLFSIVEHDDYVPEPVIPTDSDYIVGLNICSLWAYTSNHGWSCVTPYEDFRPVLGYYDEGSPEVADWEIKMMTEHGIDFQAFCWYAEQATSPLKKPRNSLQLHDGYMNAKYSDKMTYCIIWEAKNGAHPTSETFRKYFVPYWIENYFKDDRYLLIDGKPVLMIFGINNFFNDVGGAANAGKEFDYLRAEVKEQLGYEDVIILASHTKDNQNFVTAGVDGCYAYNWGTSGYSLNHVIKSNQEWANVGKTWMIPTLSTGFNSRPWHGTRYPTMTPEDYEAGLTWIKDEFFEAYPAKEEWQKNFLMLSTWNEYGEGTYIMPAEEHHGYGYLEAIRKVYTKADNSTHTDNIPTQQQVSRIAKNYPQHVRLLRAYDSYNPDVAKTAVTKYRIDFNGKEGFAVGNVTNPVYDGSVGGISASSLAYVETKDNLGYELENISFFRVKMKTSHSGKAKIYYSLRSDPGYTKDRCFSFDLTAGETTEYVVPVKATVGILDSIRIMPAEASGVEFSIESVELLCRRGLYVDEKRIEARVHPEITGEIIYFPFDPEQAQEHIMGLYYEWDYATKTLSLYGDDNRYVKFTAGSSKAVSSNGTYTLPQAVYLSDGLPMIHMETLCDVMGYDFYYSGTNFYIRTNNYEKHSVLFTMPENEWDFSYGSDLGWSAANAIVDIEDNSYHVIGTSNDIRLTSPSVSLDASKYTKVEVCMKYDSAQTVRDNIYVFFRRDTDSDMVAERGVGKTLPALSSNGEYKTFVIDMTVNENWNGIIDLVRLDPLQGAGSECHIKYVKLLADGDSSYDSFVSDELVSITHDAEDGKVPFVYSTSDLSVAVVDDPIVENNKVYKVSYKSGNRYYGFNCPVKLEPGVKYNVSCKVLAGKILEVETQSATSVKFNFDMKYDDPAQYNAKNPDDHLSGGQKIPVNGTEWVQINTSFTVNKGSYIRSTDAFRIYTDPIKVDGVDKSVEYYVDDIVITKATDTTPKVSSVTAESDGTVKVTGTTGAKYSSDKNIYVAIYDKDGRFMGVKLADQQTKDFSAEFGNAKDAYTAKVFVWSGLRIFRPIYEDIVQEVSE